MNVTYTWNLKSTELVKRERRMVVTRGFVWGDWGDAA